MFNVGHNHGDAVECEIDTSRTILRVMLLEEETPFATEIVLEIGEPGGRRPWSGLRGRPPGPPLPPPRCGMPRPRLC